MTWQFENVEYQTFARNPLASTHVELRFHPIVRITKEIASYQDKVRQFFPKFRESNVRGVSFDPQGNFSVRDDVEFEFSDIKGLNTIALSQQSLRINSQDHQCRVQMIKHYRIALDALNEIHGDINAFRLGVRYINEMDRNTISSDLGEPVEWNELVSNEYLRMPHGIADTANTNFMTEVRSNLADREGEMTLRYGLVQNQTGASDHFRFDLDRYINVEAGIDTKETIEYINKFTQDIYSLFNTVIGAKLKNWMDMEIRGDGNV